MGTLVQKPQNNMKNRLKMKSVDAGITLFFSGIHFQHFFQGKFSIFINNNVKNKIS